MATKIGLRDVGALPPNSILWDSAIRGLCVRRQHSETITWSVVYRNRDGRQKWFKLGRYPILTPTLARQEAVKILRSVTIGDDPSAERSQARNAHRRHLTTSQRAMIAAKIANLRHGGDQVSDQARNSVLAPVSQAQAADALNVSVDSVREAHKLNEEAPPEIIKAVRDGKMSLNAAKQATKTDKPWGTVDPKNIITREPAIVILTKEMIEKFETDLETINEIQKRIIMFGVQAEQLHPLRRQMYASRLKMQRDMWEHLAKHMIGGDNNLRNVKSPHCNIDIPLFKDEAPPPEDADEP
jgi:Arm DNA-binding domain